MTNSEFLPVLLQRSELRERGARFEQLLALLEAPEQTRRQAAIYALEALAHEERALAEPLVEVLSTFVRRRTALRGRPAVDATHSNVPDRLAGDVEAALCVLGRRPESGPLKNGHQERPLDLHGMMLRGAYLPFSRFTGALLYDCNLEGALLCGADLRGAWLWRTNLRRANFDEADLRGADLSGARFLTTEQLTRAQLDNSTRLPQLDEEPVPGARHWRSGRS